jgi:chromosome segregation ATPase
MASEPEKTNEPENATLRLLREMRAENASFREEVKQGFAKVGERFNGVDARFDKLESAVSELQVGFAAMRADQGRMAGTLETIHEDQQLHGSRLNAIEGRLARIEKHVGLVKA